MINIVRTRFAPSPTGYMHLGNMRAAFFNALYAFSTGGKFILRVEDTDLSRSEENYVTALQQDLHWLGLSWDEGPLEYSHNEGTGYHHDSSSSDARGDYGPYYQSKRQSIYEKYYHILEKKGLIYPCFCSDALLKATRQAQLARKLPPRYSGTCKHLSAQHVADSLAAGKKPTWRFVVPSQAKIDFVDLIKGKQSFATQHIGDFIVRRADKTAPFLFCNAIDDALMAISHVLRGEDHLANTPRQIMILQALNLPIPDYGHLSLIVGEDGTPLSKRHGSFSIRELRMQGFLSSAIINYLARLGHMMRNEADLRSAEEKEHKLMLLSLPALAERFHLAGLKHSSVVFDEMQLLYWQKLAVQHLSCLDFFEWVGPSISEKVPSVERDLFVHTIKNNVMFPSHVLNWAMIFFHHQVEFDQEAQSILINAQEVFFNVAIDAVKKYGIDFKAILATISEKLPHYKGKQLFMPLRVAFTGKIQGPELIHIMQFLGQQQLVQRLERALQFITTI